MLSGDWSSDVCSSDLLIISLAMMEALTIYGLVIAFVIAGNI